MMCLFPEALSPRKMMEKIFHIELNSWQKHNLCEYAKMSRILEIQGDNHPDHRTIGLGLIFWGTTCMYGTTSMIIVPEKTMIEESRDKFIEQLSVIQSDVVRYLNKNSIELVNSSKVLFTSMDQIYSRCCGVTLNNLFIDEHFDNIDSIDRELMASILPTVAYNGKLIVSVREKKYEERVH